ncbi:hypothetical protein, partial [Yersinia pseudotuberculosis]
PSYFKLHVRWLRSISRITYSSKLIGTLSLAAFLQLELFWVINTHSMIIIIIILRDHCEQQSIVFNHSQFFTLT